MVSKNKQYSPKLMTVDVESWVHRPIFKIPLEKQTKERDNGHLVKAIDAILPLFKQYNINATFFILGTVAEWYPDIVERIYSNGNEVGVHGYTHKTLSEHTKETFEEEISRTVEILTSLAEKPVGYRSPTFSSSDFMFEILKKYGFKYDSSIFPVRTPLYNGTKYRRRPFMITDEILELPLPVYRIWKVRIPIGGFYLRFFGSRFTKILLNTLSKDMPVMFYFHPWEIHSIPDVELHWHKKLFAYYKIPMLSKLEDVIKDMRFSSVKNLWDDINKEILEQRN